MVLLPLQVKLALEMCVLVYQTLLLPLKIARYPLWLAFHQSARGLGVYTSILGHVDGFLQDLPVGHGALEGLLHDLELRFKLVQSAVYVPTCKRCYTRLFTEKQWLCRRTRRLEW